MAFSGSSSAPLTAVPGIVYPTAAFATVAVLLRRYIQSHGAFPIAPVLIKFNSRLYAGISLWFFLTILFSRTTSSQSLGRGYVNWLLPTETSRRCAYHLSKFYEYLDIFLVLANGGQVALHFTFHHLTTPILTYVRVLQHHEGWEIFAALNALHHALMYAYFGGVSAFRPLLRFTGVLQLVIGILVEIRIIFARLAVGGIVWPNIMAATLLVCYMVLFIREMMIEDGGKKKKAKNS
ncbi:ELO family [Lipomyces orientalis]|uniref:ELO family n=1 Tax=Lipomyces orientalis TaxID=1233043 RepID=A0ACC3TG34_9ASCO